VNWGLRRPASAMAVFASASFPCKATDAAKNA
jgi:hypothetical protein